MKTVQLETWLKQNPSAVVNAVGGTMLNKVKQDLRPLQDGVYIGKRQTSESSYYMRSEAWQTTSIGISAGDADAIVVYHGGFSFGIALNESPAILPWASAGVITGASGDMELMNGKSNTDTIMSKEPSKSDDPTQYAVPFCRAYSSVNIPAGSWYLPSIAELCVIRRYFETINMAMTRINAAGKQSCALLRRDNYWSSTEYSSVGARGLEVSDGIRWKGNKVTSKKWVRPCAAF